MMRLIRNRVLVGIGFETGEFGRGFAGWDVVDELCSVSETGEDVFGFGWIKIEICLASIAGGAVP